MFVPATEDQALAGLRAASTVVDPPESAGLGQSLLIAASQLFFSPPIEVAPQDLTPISPQDLALAIGPDHDLAEHVAQHANVATEQFGAYHRQILSQLQGKVRGDAFNRRLVRRRTGRFGPNVSNGVPTGMPRRAEPVRRKGKEGSFQ